MPERDAAKFLEDFPEPASETHLEPLDTLRSKQLPSTENISLAYRAKLPEPQVRHLTMIHYLVVVPLVAICITIFVRLVGLSARSELSFFLLFVISMAASLLASADTSSPRHIVKLLLLGPAVWLGMVTLSLIDHTIAYRCLVVILVIGLVLFSDAVRAHQILWWSAEPRLPKTTRRKYFARWRSLRSRTHHRPTRWRLLIVGMVSVVGGCLAADTAAASTIRPLAGVVAFSIFWLSLVFATWLKAGSFRQCVLQWKLTLNAISLWLNYSPHATAACVFRLPGLLTRCEARRLCLTVWMCAISCVVASGACYFPLTILQSHQWLEISDSQLPVSASRELPRDMVRDNLTFDERMIYELLPYREQNSYLDEMERIQLHSNHLAAFVAQRWATIQELNDSPEGWMTFLAGSGQLFGSLGIWTIVSSIVCCAVIPLGTFLSICVAVGGPSLEEARKQLDGMRKEFETDWDGYVDAIQTSKNSIARESLWLGINEFGDYPLLLPCALLREHAHILGDTGSGKTALALAPMMSQLIRISGQKRATKSSVVVIDLKGDPALFNGARIDAEQSGVPFRWFTNLFGHETYGFNPLGQQHLSGLSPNQRAEILMDALSLQHGEGYGRSFYSKTNRRLLSRALEAFGSQIRSFADLNRVFQSNNRDLSGRKFKISPAEAKDGSELFATIESLAKIPQLNVPPVSEDGSIPPHVCNSQIDLADVFTVPQVLYFYLPAVIEAGSVREIGKLALFGLLSASTVNETAGPNPHQVYLFIDEFQQIVAENLEIVLRQARSRNIAAILANQTISDLQTSGVDLVPTVRANTRLKQFFASTDLLQQNDIVKSSGKTFRDFASLYDHDAARITQNEVMRITDDPTLSIMHLSRGGGFAQFGGFPFVVRSSFHIPKEEYDQRAGMPWPAKRQGTFEASFEKQFHADTTTLQPPQTPVDRQVKSASPKPSATATAVASPAKPAANAPTSNLLSTLDALKQESDERELQETDRADSRKLKETSNAPKTSD